MDADQRGSERQGLPLMSTEDTDQAGVGKMLPQPVGGEAYANRGEIAEVQANLG
jgi:hypothetical protein